VDNQYRNFCDFIYKCKKLKNFSIKNQDSTEIKNNFLFLNNDRLHVSKSSLWLNNFFKTGLGTQFSEAFSFFNKADKIIKSSVYIKMEIFEQCSNMFLIFLFFLNRLAINRITAVDRGFEFLFKYRSIKIKNLLIDDDLNIILFSPQIKNFYA